MTYPYVTDDGTFVEEISLEITNFPAKVIINECFGGLVLSASGEKAYKALKGIHWYDDYQRDDEILLKIYERLGREGFEKHCCKPTIVTIPEAVEVWLEIDDGWETLYWKTSEGEVYNNREEE